MVRCFQPITGVSVWSLNQVEGWLRPAWVPVNRSHATERNGGLALQSVTSKELAIFHGVGFAIIHFRWVGNHSQTKSLRSSAGLALQSLNFANKELAIFHGAGFAIGHKQQGACNLSVGGLCNHSQQTRNEKLAIFRWVGNHSQARSLRSFFAGLALQSFTNKEFAIFTGLALQSVTRSMACCARVAFVVIV